MAALRQNNSHAEYWRERSEILQESLLNNGDKAVKRLDESYKKALLEIEKEINAFYGRFADENGIDYAAAKKILNSSEINKFRMELNGYIEKGRTLNYSNQWKKELENASTAYRITRLKILELQIRQQIEMLYGEAANETENVLAKIYEDGYYQQLFMLEQGTGIAVDFTKLDAAGVKSVIHQSWAADGASFSERVWKNKTKLVTTLLDEILPTAFIRGEAPAKTIRTVLEAMGNSWNNARRIVLTESAAYAARATHDVYDKFGVEKYEFIATLDEKTCLRCGGLESMSQDKKGLPKELYRIGSTAPPLHPHCRCTTAPYFDDLYEFAADEFLNTARPQRDKNGKTVFKPNTDYIAWAYEKGILSKEEFQRNKDLERLEVSDSLAQNKNSFDVVTSSEDKSIVISKINLKKIYPDLNEIELGYAMTAHKTVLEHGLKNVTEMFLAFDKSSGKIVLQKIGSKDEIKFKTSELTKAAKDSIIFIHNHPSGSAFSPADFNTLNALESLKYMGIQGHNGEVYSLSVGNGTRHKKHDLKEELTDFFTDAFEKYGKTVEVGNIINDIVAKQYGWEFRKR